MTGTTVRDAYVLCGAITKSRARNFYYGIRLLPPDKRSVLCAVYAHVRRSGRYCRCVAGSVGRLCLAVFGGRPSRDADRYADILGIALQQTNILRDIREDLGTGRVYLPADELAARRIDHRHSGWRMRSSSRAGRPAACSGTSWVARYCSTAEQPKHPAAPTAAGTPAAIATIGWLTTAAFLTARPPPGNPANYPGSRPVVYPRTLRSRRRSSRFR